MNGSMPRMEEPRGLRLGSIGGSRIYLDLSFFILVGIFILISIESGRDPRYALLWIPTILVSVLFHELGHAATIGAFRFGPSLIILGGFGGVTINARRSRPWKEILISAAGPGASLLLAAILMVVFLTVPFLQRDPMFGSLFPLMISTNIRWAILNLFPIYPLDGGQILNQIGRFFTTTARATRFSAISSLVLAALILVWSVFNRNFFLAMLISMIAMQNFQRLQTGDRDV